jgi:hypothetical protein
MLVANQLPHPLAQFSALPPAKLHESRSCSVPVKMFV